MSEKIVRIGGASGFWGDSAVAGPQLVRRAEVDYLVYDYLAEVTMSLLVRARTKDPALGYATDFVGTAMKSILRDIARKGIKVVTNAGGVNPPACGAALRALCAEMGVDLKVAVITGDDVTPLIPGLREKGVAEMFSGIALPEKLASANAYLGAVPIAAALAEGADIVITGRCVDSALALGPLMHEFGWAPDEYDRLAAGSLVGHILECGAQGSGGLHTDWEAVERWEDIGYPIAECRADGSFVVTKPAGTGGLVVPAVVAEQMLYEVGDPSSYILPDVIADFTAVTMTQVGPDRVEVSGTRGRAPTATYKVSATYMDGWRCFGMLTVIGIDAARKAERTAEAILARTRGIFRHLNLGDYRATDIEILGAEAGYGPHSRARGAREVVMKLGVEHENPTALGIFAREIAPAGTSWSPGTTGVAGGRPKPVPIVRLFSFLLDKAALPAPSVHLGDAEIPVVLPAPGRPTTHAAPTPVAARPADGPTVEVPLIRLAWARSGDKGDSANIGIIARDPAYLPLLRAALTPDVVAGYFAHLIKGPVERFDVPGISAMNFLLREALGGGGMASLRNDPLAKGFAQMALDIPIAVPASWGLRP